MNKIKCGECQFFITTCYNPKLSFCKATNGARSVIEISLYPGCKDAKPKGYKKLPNPENNDE